ncbi:MAG TPA: hypothetical protein VFG31_02920 [Conexibacter sp.]|nr:hypothetical protein [Conexibacter sp.]
MNTATQSPSFSSGRAALASSHTAAAPRRATASASTTRTLAPQIEHERLEQRAVRVRQVLHALRERAAARDTTGGAPRPLRAAIEDFGRELAEIEQRLRRDGSAGRAQSLT